MRSTHRPTRNHWFALLFASWGACLALGCNDPEQPSPADPTPPGYTVVMSAFAPELTTLLGHTEVHETSVIDGVTFHVGTLAGNDVILVLSGIGLDRAENTTRTLLDAFEVAAIVFSGIAGGINPSLSIGDVTIPSQWAQANGGLDPQDDDFWIAVDAAMYNVAVEASKGTMLRDCTVNNTCLEDPPEIVHGGNGVSNSFFVDDSTYREWLWATFQANAVDMETSAVARIAYESDVPYIAFRSLSDLAGGGSGANELRTFFQLAADNAAAVVLAFLEGWSSRE